MRGSPHFTSRAHTTLLVACGIALNTHIMDNHPHNPPPHPMIYTCLGHQRGPRTGVAIHREQVHGARGEIGRKGMGEHYTGKDGFGGGAAASVGGGVWRFCCNPFLLTVKHLGGLLGQGPHVWWRRCGGQPPMQGNSGTPGSSSSHQTHSEQPMCCASGIDRQQFGGSIPYH